MKSKPESGKPSSKPAARPAASSTGRAASATRTSRTSAGPVKGSRKRTVKTVQRELGGSDETTKPARTRKKKAADKPAGPAVYASDLVASAATRATAAKSTSALIASTNTTPPAPLALPPIEADLPLEHRAAQVLRMAEEAFALTGSWVVFYRTMLAPGGVVDQLYTNSVARRYFETTREFAELLEMVTAIRSQDDSGSGTHEPTRMITIRVPRSLHAATIRESEELELSINAYCVTKLLQPANPRFTPLELGKRRGRRAGPQMTLTKIKVKSKKKSRDSKR